MFCKGLGAVLLRDLLQTLISKETQEQNLSYQTSSQSPVSSAENSSQKCRGDGVLREDLPVSSTMTLNLECHHAVEQNDATFPAVLRLIVLWINPYAPMGITCAGVLQRQILGLYGWS